MKHIFGTWRPVRIYSNIRRWICFLNSIIVLLRTGGFTFLSVSITCRSTLVYHQQWQHASNHICVFQIHLLYHPPAIFKIFSFWSFSREVRLVDTLEYHNIYLHTSLRSFHSHIVHNVGLLQEFQIHFAKRVLGTMCVWINKCMCGLHIYVCIIHYTYYTYIYCNPHTHIY